MNLCRLIKVPGPGLLYAGAAIGVSHLVQSTRAGAGCPRYATSTGGSLIDGYKRLGVIVI